MTLKQIKKIAKNCESCITKPCQLGCPLNNDITGFIKCIKEKNYEDAYSILSLTTVMPSLCGRICPHFKQCQGKCVKGISYDAVEIGKLEAFIGDLSIKNNWNINYPKKVNKKVAIIGGGPAGVTCAAFLRKNGIGVTIYEKHDYLGGLLVHGIPEFRLEKSLVKNVTDKIINMGIEVKYNQEFGIDFNIEDLKNYDSIFVSIGSNISNRLNINGEELDGVFGANELLEYKNHPNYKDKKVVIIGGGSTALDIARTVKRMHAKEVIIIYRRAKENMRVEIKELNEAIDEKIKFIFQNNIVNILGEEKVEQIELVKTKIENQKVIDILDSNYFLKCDYVIKAIGSHSNQKLVDGLNLKLNSNGKIDIDQFGRTSNKKIFSGGDVSETISTVAWASRAGRNAAYGIIDYLKEK